MGQVSKNFELGRRIISPDEIMVLANNQQSLFHNNWGVKPAAFIQNLQFRIVMGGLENKQFYHIKRILKT